LPELGGVFMKRIVILIDGTWNKQVVKGNTNVAKLGPLIKKSASGPVQEKLYHEGVHGETEVYTGIQA
jgi:uncharacterized protein (DUF2235 family)